MRVLPANVFRVTPDAALNPTGPAPNCITEQLNPIGSPVGISNFCKEALDEVIILPSSVASKVYEVPVRALIAFDVTLYPPSALIYVAPVIPPDEYMLLALIPALKVCNAVNVCVIPRPAIVVDVVGNVSVAVPDPTRVISAPDTPRVLDVDPPAMLNPSALFVISRLTELCFAIFIPIYYEPPPL